MIQKFLYIFVFLLIYCHTCFWVQNKNSGKSKTEIDYKRLSIVGGATAAGFILGYGLQKNMWWKGEKSDFHFNWRNDWNYALGADKIGHFYFGYLVSNIYKDAFIWSGIKEKDAALYSGIFTFSYQTFLEIRDGFSQKYGFSWGDFSANLFGSLFMIVKCNSKHLENIDFKISYYPSKRFKDGSNRYIIDDYESTYHWLSFNPVEILPSKIGELYPKFINIAIGHGVKKLDYSNSHHEFFLSLDWNLNHIKTDNGLLKILKYINKYYHLPAPAVKIYPNVVWYGIKF